jgi:tripartite-type tricarboxylate transporter receptor subunit TctC
MPHAVTENRKTMSTRVTRGFLRALIFAAAVCAGASVVNASEFYAGKTIDFVVGTDAGGGLDAYARLIARHLGRLIPGSPVVVVRNMPGAGSAKAAAFLYNVAPKDGTTIATIFPGVIIDPLLQDRAVSLFDATKFTYLGSSDNGARVCITGPSSKIKTFEQAMTEKTVIGGTQAGAPTYSYAYLAKNATGAKLDIVGGYKGTAALALAVERGEIDGICGFDWTSVKAERPDWLREGGAHLLAQIAPEPDPELTALKVPPLTSFTKSEEDRRAMKLITSQQIFARPYVAPPGVPAEQAAQLRQAFAGVLRDPQFLKDAATARASIGPSSAEEVQETVTKLYAAPSDVVQRARQLIVPADESR